MPTDPLRKLMSQHANHWEAFYVLYCCRPGRDCSVAVVEDSVARLPNEPDILEGAVGFFLDRGNDHRALQLMRQRAELLPADPELRERIGVALLFLRDFQGARREFAFAEKLDARKSAQINLGWSYYLEGKFEQAATSFANCVGLRDCAFAEAVLFHYFALARSDRAAEAQAMLTKHMEKFSGDDHEQLLLLSIHRTISGRGTVQAGSIGALVPHPG